MDASAAPCTQYSKAYEFSKVTSWLDRNGDINATHMTASGHTLLMVATMSDHDALVQELLQRGAKVDMKVNGKAALHLAATMGHPKCMRLLLDYGADPNLRVDIDDAEFTENDGLSALEIIEKGVAATGMKPRHYDCLRMLQEAVGSGSRMGR